MVSLMASARTVSTCSPHIHRLDGLLAMLRASKDLRDGQSGTICLIHAMSYLCAPWVFAGMNLLALLRLAYAVRRWSVCDLFALSH